ncbi:hypothetical protein TSOC_008251 [Tetrabaena socialis]|uniref:BTB domain-containing protein n=1 Tax=Tetrabaena socialis TaxID=47790 RepID=A0A2J7ZYY0_9CHLO|nr:hypothetical protein TSOC_008251 [Tetrabaena socialis]|eukprot:PNH05481.1 hypothetical protein TSOC_008251 [Tetrabaena socialis]
MAPLPVLHAGPRIAAAGAAGGPGSLPARVTGPSRQSQGLASHNAPAVVARAPTALGANTRTRVAASASVLTNDFRKSFDRTHERRSTEHRHEQAESLDPLEPLLEDPLDRLSADLTALSIQHAAAMAVCTPPAPAAALAALPAPAPQPPLEPPPPPPRQLQQPLQVHAHQVQSAPRGRQQQLQQAGPAGRHPPSRVASTASGLGGSAAAPSAAGARNDLGDTGLPAQLLALRDPACPVSLPPPDGLPANYLPLDNWKLDKLVLSLSANKATWRRSLVLFEWLKAAGHRMDDRLCTTLIRVCSDHGDAVSALAVYDWMTGSAAAGGAALEATAYTYTAAMRAALAGGLTDRALSVWNEAWRRHTAGRLQLDCRLCITYLELCTRLGLTDQALAMYAAMRAAPAASRMAPTVHAYTAAMRAATEGGRWYRALDIWADMRTSGCEPTGHAYSAAISACAAAGDWRRAVALFDEMTGPGAIRPDVVSCTALITALAAGGEADRAEAVVSWMLGNAVRPNARTYTALMAALGNAKRWGRAVEVLARMQTPEWGGVQPNAYTYSALLKSLGEHGQWQLAEAVFGSIERQLLGPSGGSAAATAAALSLANALAPAASAASAPPPPPAGPLAAMFAQAAAAGMSADVAAAAAIAAASTAAASPAPLDDSTGRPSGLWTSPSQLNGLQLDLRPPTPAEAAAAAGPSRRSFSLFSHHPASPAAASSLYAPSSSASSASGLSPADTPVFPADPWRSSLDAASAAAASAASPFPLAPGHYTPGLSLAPAHHAELPPFPASAFASALPSSSSSAPAPASSREQQQQQQQQLQPPVHHVLNEVVCGALMLAYERAGKWQEAVSVLLRALNLGINPNTVMYNTAISAAGKAGQLEIAEKLYGKIRQPDAVTYETMIAAYGMAGLAERAESVFAAMTGAGQRPRDYAFCGLIAAHSLAGDPEGALRVRARMRRAGVQPSVHVYNALLAACERAGQPDRALELLGSMRREGVEVDALTSQLLSLVGRQGVRSVESQQVAAAALSAAVAAYAEGCWGVASRTLPSGRPSEAAPTQTLAACGLELQPLMGADGRSGLGLGPPLQLYADPAARNGVLVAARQPYTPGRRLSCPVWDPYSSAVYLCEGHAILRLASDDTVTVVAGAVEDEGDADGPGRTARFGGDPPYLASDGAGSLYAAQGRGFRRLQLPPGVGPVAGQLGMQPQAAAGGGPVPALAAAGGPVGGRLGGQAVLAEGEVLVSTLLPHAPGRVRGLAFDGSGTGGRDGSSSSGSLLFATDTALYRLPLGDPAAAPLLLAGAEGEDGYADGRGPDARFYTICGIVLDGEGAVYVADWKGDGTAWVRRMAPDGTVSTVFTGPEATLEIAAILPNGCLALHDRFEGALHVLGLGLKLPRCHAATALPPAAPVGPPPRTLSTDLRALLDRQPDSTADVAIVVGDRTFHAHRGLLSARSDYFQQLFGGGFADGSAQQFNLPDADPVAFEVVLCWVYTGTADVPAALAAGVAELADRLLLPELCSQAVGFLEASVTAVTVPASLLWAEARGPAFSGLLSRLKAWFVENREAVMREADEEEQLLRLASTATTAAVQQPLPATPSTAAAAANNPASTPAPCQPAAPPAPAPAQLPAASVGGGAGAAGGASVSSGASTGGSVASPAPELLSPPPPSPAPELLSPPPPSPAPELLSPPPPSPAPELLSPPPPSPAPELLSPPPPSPAPELLSPPPPSPAPELLSPPPPSPAPELLSPPPPSPAPELPSPPPLSPALKLPSPPPPSPSPELPSPAPELLSPPPPSPAPELPSPPPLSPALKLSSPPPTSPSPEPRSPPAPSSAPELPSPPPSHAAPTLLSMPPPPPGPAEGCCGVASRTLPGGRPGEAAPTQTLVACGRELRPLTGADGRSGLAPGPLLQLYADPAACDGELVAARQPYMPKRQLAGLIWDPYSSAIYMCEGQAILQLASDDTVTVVAGAVEDEGNADGPGRTARFGGDPPYLASDGAGSLYAAHGRGFRRLQLPPGVGPVAGQLGMQPQAAAGGGPVPALAAAGGPVGGRLGGQAVLAEGEVLVSTLLPHAPDDVSGLAFDGSGTGGGDGSSSSGSLLFATDTALYRLPLGDPAAAPLLLAGAEGVEGAAGDGHGPDARFYTICGIVLDGEGAVYVADLGGDGTTSVRRVAADRIVTTVVKGLEGTLGIAAILPNGCLALYDVFEGTLHVLGLGLELPRWHAATALPPAGPVGPPPRTLPTDLRALLDRQRDSTADVAILVGDRTFHAHRGLLSARSDYFQQLFGGGFADGSVQQFNLPDADPVAFEVVLSWVYTGTADVPAALAAGVTELADRLLLPELCSHAVAVLEASVTAVTVPASLLWAEARGPAFFGLLLRLKAWFVENREAVMREAEEEVRLLMECSPNLMLELKHDT